MIFEQEHTKLPGNKVKKIVKFLNGKRTIKRKCGDGFKYDPVHKRCIKIDMATRRKMKLGAKKRIRAMRAKMGIIVRKRMKSMKIRNSRMKKVPRVPLNPIKNTETTE